MNPMKAAGILNLLPERFVTDISKKIIAGILKKYADICVEGLENLADIRRPTIFISNHLSNADGLILSKVLKDVDPAFVAGVKLSKNSFTNLGVRAVKTVAIKPNSADQEGIKNIVKLVKQGESLLIFPEGTRSRVGSLIEAKKGILLIARLTGAPIVPVGLNGTEKLLPINMEGKMGKEVFHHARVNVRIGRQFDLPERTAGVDKKAHEDYLATYAMLKIAELLPDEYRGVYRDAVV